MDDARARIRALWLRSTTLEDVKQSAGIAWSSLAKELTSDAKAGSVDDWVEDGSSRLADLSSAAKALVVATVAHAAAEKEVEEAVDAMRAEFVVPATAAALATLWARAIETRAIVTSETSDDTIAVSVKESDLYGIEMFSAGEEAWTSFTYDACNSSECELVRAETDDGPVFAVLYSDTQIDGTTESDVMLASEAHAECFKTAIDAMLASRGVSASDDEDEDEDDEDDDDGDGDDEEDDD